MNEQIQEYLELCEQKYNELEVANEEKDKIIIPPKTDFLTNQNEMDLIKKYMIEKDDLLKKSLITLFKNNSVIISGVLSIRNNEFRRYRGQYKLELQEVKKIIYDYCNYLKLTEEEKEILDFCFKLVNYEDYSDYGGLRSINERWETKTYKLSKIHYVYDKESKEFKSFNIIELYPDGKIKFKIVDDNTYDTYDEFDEEQTNMLIYHFQDKIKGLKDSFDNDLKDIRVRFESEIKNIREKCGKYLLVASLKSGDK